MFEICETFSWKQDYDQLSEHKDLPVHTVAFPVKHINVLANFDLPLEIQK